MDKTRQMSESILIAIFLTLGGGFRDAYSYNCRGQVFANAQTGNLVLLSQNLAKGNFHMALKYVFPIIAFMVGVYLTDIIKMYFREFKIIHWRQIIVLMEIIMLAAVGFMPESMEHIANVTISLACAMQVESFRRFLGVPMATTMCTGNMRSATELLSSYHMTGDVEKKKKSRYYYLVIFMFGVGAALGALFSIHIGKRAIWIDVAIMIIAFLLMFREEKVI